MAWNSARDEDDMGQLFGGDVPATVPVIPVGPSDVTVQIQSPPSSPPAAAAATASSSAPYVPPRQRRAAEAKGAGAAAGASQRYHENTLDESVGATLLRDVKSIWNNLKLVCAPFSKPDELQNMLKHWDLWGPLIFTLFLAALLSVSSDKQQVMFSMVIVVVVVGAVMLTVNVILLGGSISFFQSICLLGYCLFPIDVAALIVALLPSSAAFLWLRVLLTIVGLLWSMKASIPFVGGSVGLNRRFLAVYPVCLMYSFLSWLAIVS